MTPTRRSFRSMLMKALGVSVFCWNAAGAQSVQEYLPSPTAGYAGIAVTVDGAVWYPEMASSIIGTYKNGQSLIPIDTPTLDAGPQSIVVGLDGNLWFLEAKVQKIARINADRSISEEAVPCRISSGLFRGLDALWFAEQCAGSEELVRVTTGGALSRYDITTSSAFPGAFGIVQTADGKVWFTEYNRGKIGRIDPVALTISEFPIPADLSLPFILFAGTDGNLWFAAATSNNLGRVDPMGNVTEIDWPEADTLSSVILGADGAFWAIDDHKHVWRYVVDADTVVARQIPSKEQGLGFSQMATAPDGNIWFVEEGPASRSAIGLIRMDGIFTDDLEAPLP